MRQRRTRSPSPEVPGKAQQSCTSPPDPSLDTLRDARVNFLIFPALPALVPAATSSRFRVFPLTPKSVQLLIAVINEEEKLDEILSGMIELGITGATIVNSEGMGRVLSHDIPIFAGLEALAMRSRPQNQTLFSVIREDDKVDGVMELLKEICGDLENPATGIAFTIPVTRVIGLAPELGQERGDSPR